MSEDPLGFGAGDTNLYRYCGGDPVNGSDPSGMVTDKSKKQNNGINPGAAPNNNRLGPQRVPGLTSWGGGDWISNARGLTNRDVAALAESGRDANNIPFGPGNGIFVGYVSIDNPRDSDGTAILRAQVPAVGRSLTGMVKVNPFRNRWQNDLPSYRTLANLLSR